MNSYICQEGNSVRNARLPETVFKQTQVKKVTKTKRSTEVDDAPMYKVLVIGDEEYSREHVVLSIQEIVPETDNTRVRFWNRVSTSR